MTTPELPAKDECSWCAGSGIEPKFSADDEGGACHACSGTGQKSGRLKTQSQPLASDQSCNRCKGSGIVRDTDTNMGGPCPDCSPEWQRSSNPQAHLGIVIGERMRREGCTIHWPGGEVQIVPRATVVASERTP